MTRPTPPRFEDVSLEVEALVQALSNATSIAGPAPPVEADLWRIYARSEVAVARLKYRLGVERPGAFSTLPRPELPAELLPEALADMRKAASLMRSGEPDAALGSLRSARTSLRAYLAEIERVRRREKRKAAASRRPSSSSS